MTAMATSDNLLLIEKHRQGNGEFGTHDRLAPESTYEPDPYPYPFPSLAGGLHPALISLGLTRDGDQWVCTAHEILFGDGEGVRTDPTPLVTMTALPLSAEQAAGLGGDRTETVNGVHWTSLAEAPAWLRDAAIPALIDGDPHAQSSADTSAWRKARHDQIIAAGGFCSSYDNNVIADAEDVYGSAVPADAVAALSDLRSLDADDDDDACVEWELAAAELSRRASHGVGGVLTDARALTAGDQVSLKHLDGALSGLSNLDTSELLTVTSPAEKINDSLTAITLNGQTVYVPTGTRLPAAGYAREGRVLRDAELRTELLERADVSYRRRDLPVAELVEHVNTVRGLTPTDPDYIHPLIPTTTGATL